MCKGMFVTEKSGCLRVPSSDLNMKKKYIYGKSNKSILRIPLLHIQKKKKSLFFVPMFCVTGAVMYSATSFSSYQSYADRWLK